MSSEQQAAHSVSGDSYISNPFLNTTRALVQILKANPVAALLTPLFGVALYILWIVAIFISAASASSGAAIGISVIALVAYIGLLGVFYVIGGAGARNQTVTSGEAMSRGFDNLPRLLGVTILTVVISIIGLILLIIPGIIFIARSSLAGLLIYEENLGPIAAIKRSFALTKGHTIEMIGAGFASAFLSGAYSLLWGASTVAPVVGRYHDLAKLQKSGHATPKVHWLNWLGVVFTALFVLLFVWIIHDAWQNADNASTFDTDSSLTSDPYDFNSLYNDGN